MAFAQDFEVWTHKAPALHVLQLRCDGPFHLERRWYSQFFDPRAQAEKFRRRVIWVDRLTAHAGTNAPVNIS